MGVEQSEGATVDPAGDLAVVEAAGPATARSQSSDRYDQLDPERRRLLLIGAVVGVFFDVIRYYAHLPFITYLDTRPLLYELVLPSTGANVIGGAQARVGLTPWWAVFAISMVSYLAVHPLRWVAGRYFLDHYSEQFLGSYTKVIRRVERFTARWGFWSLLLVWFTPIPALLVQLFVAAGGISLKKFLIGDALGWLAFTGLTFGLGYAFGETVVKVIKKVNHYGLYATIGIIVVVFVVTLVRELRRARVAES